MKQIWPWLLVFALALILRLAVTQKFVGLDAPPRADANPDQVEYELLAWRLANGDGYTWNDGTPTAARPPGTSLTLLPVYLICRRSWAVARSWFCVLSALTCLAAGWLGQQLGGRAVGLLAALGLALYPGHFYYSMHFLSEVPYALFLTLGTACTVRGLKDGGWKWDVAAGLCWGLAVLTRPNAILIVPLLGLLILYPRIEGRPQWRQMLAQTLALLLVVAPWVLRNQQVIGIATLSTVSGTTFWGAHNERILADSELAGMWIRTSDLVDEQHPLPPGELERERQMRQYGNDFLRENVGQIPYLEVMKLYRLLTPFERTENRIVYWLFALAWILLVPFVVCGMWIGWRDARAQTLVILVPVIVTVITVLLFYGSIRFRDSLAPLLVVFAALGWGRLLPQRIATWLG